MSSLNGIQPRNRNEKRILNKINRIRKILNLKPLSKILKGNMGSINSCPIAKSIHYGSHDIDVCVDGDSIIVDPINMTEGEEELYSEEVPQYIEEWITKFDNGNIPELIEK